MKLQIETGRGWIGNSHRGSGSTGNEGGGKTTSSLKTSWITDETATEGSLSEFLNGLRAALPTAAIVFLCLLSSACGPAIVTVGEPTPVDIHQSYWWMWAYPYYPRVAEFYYYHNYHYCPLEE